MRRNPGQISVLRPVLVPLTIGPPFSTVADALWDTLKG
jgi:hypothetical protein